MKNTASLDSFTLTKSAVLTALDPETRCAEDLFALIRRMLNECNYRASQLFQSINTHGALSTVKGLINAPTPSDGFVTMLLKGRLDLSVEAIAVAADWRHLLTAAELERAYGRLADAGYETTAKAA